MVEIGAGQAERAAIFGEEDPRLPAEILVAIAALYLATGDEDLQIGAGGRALRCAAHRGSSDSPQPSVVRRAAASRQLKCAGNSRGRDHLRYRLVLDRGGGQAGHVVGIAEHAESVQRRMAGVAHEH